VTQPARPRTSVVDDPLLAVVRLLAEHGADGVRLAVELLHNRYDAHLTLRTMPDGTVVAQAPAVVPAQRRPAEDQPCLLDLPVRHAGATLAVLSVSRRRPLSARAADMLRAVADALGLALTAMRASPRAAAQTVLDAEADRAQLAEDIADLRAALVALRHTDPADVPTAVTAALAAVRDIGHELRATALVDGLPAVLAGMTAAGAQVEVDGVDLDRLAPAVAVLAQRVVEAATRGSVETALIVAIARGNRVKLSAECADNSMDAFELDRWARRARALGGDLRHWPGAVELTLPMPASDEGNDDHRPHL